MEQTNNLFDYEESALNKALELCDSELFANNELLPEFRKLCKDYKKLLRQTKTLIKISDNQQKMLNEINEKQIQLTKEITDSIYYAKNIQKAILPKEDLFKEYLKDYFILFLPRDIVSGDFYWATSKNDTLIFTAADCTGHGVPGAFMSMLGVAFLNEIVNKENILEPNQILNELRQLIMRSLQQKGGYSEQKDGMDISFCSFDKKQMKLKYAGANNPLYIIRNSELIEYKGDKMPIAIHLVMNDFTMHEIDVQENDTIFIFSDGYADQFGGPDGKKYKYKPFKELLISVSHFPMDKQKQIIHDNFKDWIAHKDHTTGKQFEQVDDIVLIGIKI